MVSNAPVHGTILTSTKQNKNMTTERQTKLVECKKKNSESCRQVLGKTEEGLRYPPLDLWGIMFIGSCVFQIFGKKYLDAFLKLFEVRFFFWLWEKFGIVAGF